MPTIPAYLTKITPPRSSWESRKLWVEHGGECLVFAVFDQPTTSRVTEIRARISNHIRLQPKWPAIQDKLRLWRPVPASGVDFYRDLLREQAQSLVPFKAQTTGAFSSKFSVSVASLGINVSGDVLLPVTKMSGAFEAIPNISYADVVKSKISPKYRPKISIASSVSSELAQSGLQRLRAELEMAPLVLTIVGLCMRIRPPHPYGMHGYVTGEAHRTPDEYFVFPSPADSTARTQDKEPAEVP